MLVLISRPQPEIQIRPFPRMPKVPFQQLYPKAHPLAIDLLEMLLKFDPTQRISADEALRHPYFTTSHAISGQQGQGQQQQQQAQQQAQAQAQNGGWAQVRLARGCVA